MTISKKLFFDNLPDTFGDSVIIGVKIPKTVTRSNPYNILFGVKAVDENSQISVKYGNGKKDFIYVQDNSKYTCLSSEYKISKLCQIKVKNISSLSVSNTSNIKNLPIISSLIEIDDQLSSIKSISQGCFYYCNGLTTINLPGLTSLPNSAFYYCNQVKSYNFPNVKTISGGAFMTNSSCISIDVPVCETILANGLNGLPNLKTISLPKIKSIGTTIFYGSGLNEIHLPSCLTSIAGNAFAGRSLTSLTVDEDNPYYFVKHNCIYSKQNPSKVIVGTTNADWDGILEDTTEIGDQAFGYNMNPRFKDYLYVPNIKKIGAAAFSTFYTSISAYFPDAETVGTEFVGANSRLTYIRFDNLKAMNGQNPFYNNNNANLSIDLRYNQYIVRFSQDENLMFKYTTGNFKILVSPAQYEAYLNEPGWRKYPDHIYQMSPDT